MKVLIKRPIHGTYSRQELEWIECNYGVQYPYKIFSPNYYNLGDGHFIHKMDCEIVGAEPRLPLDSNNPVVSKEPTEMQKLEWENAALRGALQYLVDTKDRKDTIGKDSIYMSRQRMGWIQARNLLKG